MLKNRNNNEITPAIGIGLLEFPSYIIIVLRNWRYLSIWCFFMDQIICPESCNAVMKITAFGIEMSNALQSA